MKISVLTGTYNRANLLGNLYNSLIANSKFGIEIEWLIMDDGSTDNTKQVVEKFIEEERIQIKYNRQENQGKMTALNNLINDASGDVVVECDSDDYFSENAFAIIEQEFKKYKDRKDIYAICFLKYDSQGNNIGDNFKNNETTMFDLYFKEGEKGEKSLVYFTNIRKQYKYKIENNEKFGTEARLHHEMDLKYKIACCNKPIMICEYRQDGYTKNIQKIFKENPYGYYEYFKEILKRDMRGVLFNKRLYTIKHYILFSVLTNRKIELKEVKNLLNKILIILLYLPGYIKSNKF
ncbi:MAG: glycosyltransferase family 2 protein [Clostridia bacterium]|nr:glycosyltransferase family 2 protein [Clostridia bacterium]